jgi:hypothetical protein
MAGKIPPTAKICKKPKQSKRRKSVVQIQEKWWAGLNIRHLDAPIVTTKEGHVAVSGVTCKPDHDLGGFGLCGTGTVNLTYKTGRCTTRVPVVVFWKGAQMSESGRQTLPSLYRESKFYSEYCKDLQPHVPVTLGYFAIPARFANQLDIDSRARVGIVMAEYTPVNTLLTKTAMDPSATRRLLVSFLTACGRVHGKGVLHCDLKTSNLAVERGLDPCIRILDWGSWANILDKRNAHRMGTPFWRKYEWFGDGTLGRMLPADVYFHIGMVVLHFFAGQRHKLTRRGSDQKIARELGDAFQKQKDTNWCRFLVSHTAIQTTVRHQGLQNFQLALSERLGGCDALVEAVGVLWKGQPQSTQQAKATSRGTALLDLAETLNQDCLWRSFGTSPLGRL